MSLVCIVDDTDPDIHYSGSWETGLSVDANSNEYKSTFHSSQADGNWLDYTFFGTEISVYGTLNASGINNPPNVSFSIDDGSPQAFNSTGSVRVFDSALISSHVLLYRASDLTKNAPHTLTIKTGTLTSPAALFYFDFFTVSTEADKASGSIIVDDRDLLISITGSWGLQGIIGNYMETTRQGPPPDGGTATFRFNGTSVAVYGTTLSPLGANTTAAIRFNVDNSQVLDFTGPPNSTWVRHIPLVQVDGLSTNQEHVLEIASLNSDKWFLDYIVYETADNGGQDNTLSAGKVAGAVIGAFFGVAMIVVAVFLILCRRKVSHDVVNARTSRGSEAREALVVPFTTSNLQNGVLTDIEDTGGEMGISGMIPASKERMAGGRTALVLNVASTSVHSGVVSPIDGSIATVDTQSMVPPTAEQHQEQAPAQAQNEVIYSHNNPLYPQFDAGGDPRIPFDRGYAPVLPRTSHSQAIEDTPENKTQLPHTRPSVPRPPRRSPPPPMIEEDSGIRIPATLSTRVYA